MDPLYLTYQFSENLFADKDLLIDCILVYVKVFKLLDNDSSGQPMSIFQGGINFVLSREEC